MVITSVGIDTFRDPLTKEEVIIYNIQISVNFRDVCMTLYYGTMWRETL